MHLSLIDKHVIKGSVSEWTRQEVLLSQWVSASVTKHGFSVLCLSNGHGFDLPGRVHRPVTV